MFKNYLLNIHKFSSLFFKIFFIFILVSFVAQKSSATHLRAGEITAERTDCSSLTFRITVTVYTDSEGGNPVLFGGGILDFGDKRSVRLPGEIRNNTRYTILPNGEVLIEPLDGSNLGDNVAIAKFVMDYTYSSADRYIISYEEDFRNPGVLNIDNSVGTSFHIDTQVFVDPFILCNNTPILLIPPIDVACSGVAFFHNPGAFDPDGDSLAFELVVPKRVTGLDASGYKPPNDPGFYTDFERGDETQSTRPTFSIDPVIGDITWDAPGIVGEYNIAFRVIEYRKVNGQYSPLGYVVRDMQIIVEDCDNERPELIIPEDICVEAGQVIDETIFGLDPDNHDVKIEASSEVFELGATVAPLNMFQPSSPAAELQFRWETECLDVREQTYKVVFKITDNPPLGSNLVGRFATWNIKVIGPKPVPESVERQGQSLNLNWEDYACENAETIQIWRRVNENPYLPDSCETGIRANAGYTLLDELPSSAVSYQDTDLAAAAKYCYRLLAIFPDNRRTESVVSDEICFEFVPAEEPVITHVSVTKTDFADGEIIVAWREPFELGNLTLPYLYQIERADGFNGDNFIPVGTFTDNIGVMDSIAFKDKGVNTRDNVYNYRIGIIDPSGLNPDEILYSAAASSVRTEILPGFGEIVLNWQADVPWSNSITSTGDNEHYIFRGLEGDAESELTLIASVDVTQFGFRYVDKNVEQGSVYCYRVLTKGTYGNPEIRSPLLNFSQIICAQTNDSIPPCAPVISVSGLSCEEFVAQQECSLNNVVFSNTINFTTSDLPECVDDIREYKIFYASTVDGRFDQIAEVSDESFIHELPDSFKGCYKVKAVDRSGNESEFSEVFCVDNCPNYVLPNVFTPDNADAANDSFRPFGPESDIALCARFVLEVKFEVFNRWGKQVYTYSGLRKSENNDIYINWDGRNLNGEALSAGVYYYLAEVKYDVVDPAKSVEKLKGWVQIIR